MIQSRTKAVIKIPALIGMNVLVMLALVSLGRGSEDRLGELVGFLQAGRHGDPVNGLGLFVFVPGGP